MGMMGLMELIVVLDAVPAVLVLGIGLIVLIRRRAVLGRRAAVAVAGAAVLLAGTLAHTLLDVHAYRTIEDGTLGLPWWIQVADLVLLPADLLGLPLLAWAVLAGRSPRPATVTA
jgi:hypothetical protein